MLLLQVNHLLNKINYDTGKNTSMPEEAVSSITAADEPASNAENSPQSEIDALKIKILKNLDNQSTGVVYDKDVFNVLLIGSDSRTGKGYGRSDAMILLSINRKTKKIVMTSLMRDIYLSIPGHDSNRINAAYAFGGPSLLLRTIRENLRIQVDKYVAVSFFTFIDIIDKLGGVTADLSDAECDSMNGYIHELNVLLGLPVNDGKIWKGGKNILLTGKQALGYARVRYVGNADFERTERQRLILDQIVDKLKKQSITKLYGILNDFLPHVTTNLTKGELFSLLLASRTYAGYPLEQYRVPVNGSYKGLMIGKKSVLGIDFDENIAFMRSKIY